MPDSRASLRVAKPRPAAEPRATIGTRSLWSMTPPMIAPVANEQTPTLTLQQRLTFASCEGVRACGMTRSTRAQIRFFSACDCRGGYSRWVRSPAPTALARDGPAGEELDAARDPGWGPSPSMLAPWWLRRRSSLRGSWGRSSGWRSPGRRLVVSSLPTLKPRPASRIRWTCCVEINTSTPPSTS